MGFSSRSRIHSRCLLWVMHKIVKHCLHVWSWAGTRGCSWCAERLGWCSTPGCSYWRNTLQIDSTFLQLEIDTAFSLEEYLQLQDWSWNRFMCRDFTNLDIFPYESWVYQKVVLVSRRNHHLSGAEAVGRVNSGSNKNLEFTEMVILASEKYK